MDEEITKIIKKGSKIKIAFWILAIISVCAFCFFSNVILQYTDKAANLPDIML